MRSWRVRSLTQHRRNPARQDYLLVSSARIRVDLYHKDSAGGLGGRTTARPLFHCN
ncbi:hypothetical protein [Sphaerothrix gracilis]|uniref:hypothetical protein n=1 Tax=Sphaerothrix gracilis TaxID=3151835 RepID=UPI0031FC26D8